MQHFLYDCNYCKNLHIVHSLGVQKFIENDIQGFLKKSVTSFASLQNKIKICPNVEDYLKRNYFKLYEGLGPFYYSNLNGPYFLIKNYLEHTKSAQNVNGIQCNFCELYACDFHANYNFKYSKCTCNHITDTYSKKVCNQFISICFWCYDFLLKNYPEKSNFCTDCINSQKCINDNMIIICDKIKNNKLKLSNEIIKSISNVEIGKIDIFY